MKEEEKKEEGEEEHPFTPRPSHHAGPRVTPRSPQASRQTAQEHCDRSRRRQKVPLRHQKIPKMTQFLRCVCRTVRIQPARCLFISWGKTVQTSGATSTAAASATPRCTRPRRATSGTSDEGSYRCRFGPGAYGGGHRGQRQRRDTGACAGARRRSGHLCRRGLPRCEQAPMGAILDQLEQAKARIRAKVEHPFRVIKRQFGHVKVRYRGLAKNTA